MLDSEIISNKTEKKRKEIKKRSANRKNQLKFIIISMAPILLLFVVFVFIPIVWSIILSLYKYNPLAHHQPFVGLANYTKLWHDNVFRESFYATLIFVFIAVPANLIITLSIASMISKVRGNFWRSLFRTMFFLPALAPLVASSLIWSTMLHSGNDGLFNIILGYFGIGNVGWLEHGFLAMLCVIVMTLWADVAYNIIIFGAGLDAIPKVFYEAAKLDGAGRFQMITKITIPLLQRTTLFVFVVTVISYFQMFAQFQVMTNGGPQNATNVLSLNIYNYAFQYGQMGYASAMATVFFVIIMIVALIQIRLGRTQWEY